MLNKLFLEYHHVLYTQKSNDLDKSAEIRKAGKIDEKYKKILLMKNSHVGERCFIVATGPSLTLSDLELLKNEVTFGMNSICKIFKDTTWRPTYYGIQDSLVYEKMEVFIKDSFCEKDNVLVADHLGEHFNLPNYYIQFPFNHYYHQYQSEKKQYFVKFSDNSYVMVYDGYSITYSLIQIANYMGFKEIYLLGADCNYEKGKKNHFVESGFIDKNAYDSFERLMLGYYEVKKYISDKDIKVINCTRGGKLEIFPRASLESILNI